MPSPFPGMDPYLEDPDLWPEFVASMAYAIRGRLNAVLPPRYVASLDRHALQHDPDNDSRPLLIFKNPERCLVTVVEILPLSKKAPGPAREEYLRKRRSLLASRTNLVEIDLRRAGQRMPPTMPLPTRTNYLIHIGHGAPSLWFATWPISVRDPLPDVPLPLDTDDIEVCIPLQACLDRVYDEARYSLRLSYSRPPSPPLDEPDATWARQLLSNRAP
jgi:hypothetical protein